MLEEFIQRKYVSAKSFSLEGSESLIPLLHLAIDRAAQHGVSEVTLGMAHRGRLNVLANLMGKSPREIFREFDDVDPELYRGRGDVKYHIGRSVRFQDVQRARRAPVLVLQPESPRVRQRRGARAGACQARPCG